MPNMDRKSKAEYQHYIPQFLLRNFSHPFNGEKSTKNPRTGEWDQTNTSPRIYPGEPMLNAISLDKDPPELVQIPVKRTFGQPDMYVNEFKFDHQKQMRIEEKLGLLEATASKIINKIKEAQLCKKEVWISRLEKDTLHKFLFVMKYRGPIFFRRFNHLRAKDYNADDKIQFLEYMREENFERPLDVWFHNLTEILDAKIDPEGQWIQDLFKRIYPGDALWLYMNVRTMYLVLCTPSDPSEEFIVTENAFSIYEGPASFSKDPVTGETIMGANTECHVLGVISPNLMMLLRSRFLPEAMDENIERFRKPRKQRCAVVDWSGYDHRNMRSLLVDLPVIEARNFHIREKDGQLEVGESEDGVKRFSDMFCFTFFRLPTRHMQMLNAVVLDQVHHVSTIVFQNGAALRKALRYYLDMPTHHGHYSICTCNNQTDDPRLLMSKKLEHATQLLGSKIEAEYHITPLGAEDDWLRFIDTINQVLNDDSSVRNNPFFICMGIFLEGLTELEVDITDIHAMTLIGANNLSYILEIVFAGIQEDGQGKFNQSVPYSATIPITMWRLAWDTICAIASENFCENESLLESIREETAKWTNTFPQRTFQRSKRWPNEEFLQVYKELNRGQISFSQARQEDGKPNYAALQQSMSTSFSRPRNATYMLGNEFASDKSLATQTSSHTLKMNSNNTPIKKSLYIPTREIVGKSDERLARNKSAAAHVYQQGRRRQVYQTGFYNKKQALDHSASTLWEKIHSGIISVLSIIAVLYLIILVAVVISHLGVELVCKVGIMILLFVLVFRLIGLGFRLLVSILRFLFRF